MIKAIIFDCFGVLTTDLWKEFLGSLPEDTDFEQLRSLNYQLDRGEIESDHFMSEVRRVTGKELKRVEFLSNDQMKSKNIKLMDYIKELKQEFKIGLLSNISSDWVREVFLDQQEQKNFDDIVFSYEVGLIKPSAEIFELSCSRLGVQTKESVFIDDNEVNCEGASKVGMKAILYRNFDSFKKEVERVLDVRVE